MEREQRERVRLVSLAKEKEEETEGDRKRVRGRGERKSAFNAMFNEEREKKVGIQCDQNCVAVGVAVMFHFN
jgi:hypothetical protein